MKTEEVIRDLANTLQEAHSEALRALRELRAEKNSKQVEIDAFKPAKLDRRRWEECPDCWLWESINKFCPYCGKPQTEEAWAELERRIGGNDG